MTEPRCLGSSQEASALVETDKFEGAFIDWDACDLSGEELTRRIRRSKLNAKIPIAMLTARTETCIVAEGFEAGVTYHLAKPFGAKELRRLLNASRGTMLVERRRYNRWPKTFQVICEWGPKGERKRIAGKSIDVSTTGMLMTLFPEPEVGTALSLELLLPEAPKGLVLKGVVLRRHAARHVAIRFIRAPAEQEDFLETYLSRSLNDLPHFDG